jgi:multisubunit Na+/H+ antiporter MnhB subunit
MVFNTIATIVFMAIFMSLAYISLKGIARFGEPAMRVSKAYIGDCVARTGELNVVSAITLNFRALDLLGEVAILFAAIVGVLAVARKVGHTGSR